MILESHLALGETDAVGPEERGAEHLVRCEHLQQGIGPEHRARDVVAEDPAREATTDADLLAHDHVGRVQVGVVAQLLERTVEQVVVLVDELHVGAAGGIDSVVAGHARPTGVLQREHAHVGAIAGDGRQARAGGLAGAVVAQEHLEGRGAQGLAIERSDEVVERGPGSEHRDDHAHADGVSSAGAVLRSITL